LLIKVLWVYMLNFYASVHLVTAVCRKYYMTDITPSVPALTHSLPTCLSAISFWI
jgi:hypothetical protein